MEKDARLFNCARCHRQKLICPCCDRGNIYCRSCSKAARKESVKAAGHRYQNSPRGKYQHAARQRRYRQRQKEKVTHQGLPILSINDSLSVELSEGVLHLMPERNNQLRCHFCYKSCFVFVRLGFMQSRTHVQTQRKTCWPFEP